MEKNLNIEETFLFNSKNVYITFKKLNDYLALIVSIFPILYGISEYKFTDMSVYIICALVIYSPYYLKRKFKIVILEECKLITTIHIGLHTILGKAFHFYEIYPLFDSILHVLGGMWLFLLLFSIIYSIELHFTKLGKNKIDLKATIITFFTVNTLGVMWEIFEFVADLIFAGTPGYNLAQEGSLFDTMTDLIENNVGAFLACFIFWKIVSIQKRKGRYISQLFRDVLPF